MGKDVPTDVLSFPMDELRRGLVDEEPEQGFLGDLVLCPGIATRQAREAREHGTLSELKAQLALHGLLHLLGYDHAETEWHEARCSACSEGLLTAWPRHVGAARAPATSGCW